MRQPLDEQLGRSGPLAVEAAGERPTDLGVHPPLTAGTGLLGGGREQPVLEAAHLGLPVLHVVGLGNLKIGIIWSFFSKFTLVTRVPLV